jgi:glycosyltransferase involved in cell wall biosynthesis
MNNMLFSFLKYLQPTHYFSLGKKNGNTLFPVYESLPEAIKQQLDLDDAYASDLAKQYDLSWQALNKGYIGNTKTIKTIEPVSVIDNYIFIRKYFSRFWVVYVLCLRLLRFKQPFKEIPAYLKSRSIQRSSFLKSPLQYVDWDSFDSALVAAQPKVSVIIPTLNRYTYLSDVLKDLEQQDYKNFEVIVVDQSESFQEEFYSDYSLDLKLLYQEEKALWLARNTAIRQSKGDYLLLFDDDSRVDANWITNHLKCLDVFKAEISSGISISKVGAKVPEHYAFFRVSDQLDTGNVLIKKDVFKAIGLFDRQFEKQRMGDGEYGLRAYLHGFLNVSNPYAKRLHLKVGTGGLREMGSWDAFRTQKWFSPRPIPSVLYFFRRYFGDQAAKLALFRTVPLSIMPYQFKTNKVMMLLGVFVTLLLMPLVLFQVFRSWRLSSKKLKQGPMIEGFDD